MLDQGRRCLNHAGLYHRVLIPGRVTLGRRRLHAAFWRHGANDVYLIPTFYSRSLSRLFEPENIADRDSEWRGPSLKLRTRRSSHHFQSYHDFDPSHKHMLICDWQFWRASIHFTKSLRAFVSWAGKGRTKGAPGDDVRKESRVKYPGIDSSEALKELQGILLAFKDGQSEPSCTEAWRIFCSLNDLQKTPGLTNALIEFLASSVRSRDITRALQLFDGLAPYDRQPNIYAALLPPLVKDGQMTKAVTIVEGALNARVSPPIAGAEILLSHLIENRYWQVLFRVWSICVESFEDETFKTQWEEAFFRNQPSKPNYSDRVASLMHAIEAFPNSISPEVDKTFVSKAVHSVFARGNHFGARNNARICDTMRQLGLLSYRMFETAIYGTLEDIDYVEHQRVNYAFEIYQHPPKDSFPSATLLHRLLNRASRVQHASAIYRIYRDWIKWHGQPLGKLANLFMKSFAPLGEKQIVDDLLQLTMTTGDKQDLNMHYPALHVRALLASPSDVKKQMKWMEHQGIETDITCWNILMNAYQRDEDLAGAVDCMAQILESNLSADIYTIGTLMAMAADRADTELAAQLFETAATLNISKERQQYLNDCMVLALLNNNSWQEAEDLATSVTKDTKPEDCTLMWNQILTYHALHPPPAGLTSAFRVARAMSTLQVPFDSSTYGAMMRAHTISLRPDDAKDILFKVLPRNSIPLTAFHFSIVIEGYVAQLALEKGIRVYAEMLRRRVKPDISSNMALLHLQIAAVKNKISLERAFLPGVRADVPEELFEDILKSEDPLAALNKKPWRGSSRFKVTEASPAAYFDCLISFYGDLKAYDVISSLLSRYRREHGSKFPLRLLSRAMGDCYRKRRHMDVEWYWNLAKESAVDTGMTGDRLAQREKTPWLSPGRRTLLARHLDYYLRSLRGRNSLERMREEINAYQAAGFDLDNRNWNLYVQLLIIGGQTLEAFETCETVLMPSFGGWRRRNEPTPRRQESRVRSYGMQYRGDPGWYFVKLGVFEVEYGTIVRLHKVLLELRKQAPFKITAKNLAGEIRSKAPKTVSAALEMPRYKTGVTRHLLSPSLVQYWRRGRERRGRSRKARSEALNSELDAASPPNHAMQGNFSIKDENVEGIKV